MPFKNLSIINWIRVILIFINLHIKVQHFISKNHISECNTSVYFHLYPNIALRCVWIRNEVLLPDVQLYKSPYHSDATYNRKIFEWHGFISCNDFLMGSFWDERSAAICSTMQLALQWEPSAAVYSVWSDLVNFRVVNLPKWAKWVKKGHSGQ